MKLEKFYIFVVEKVFNLNDIHTMKKLIVCLLLSSLYLSACGKSDSETTIQAPSNENSETKEYMNEAYEFINSAKIGWNFGNQFDAHRNGVSSETAWGNPIAEPEIFSYIAKCGFGLVRIPVTWQGHIGNADSGYKVEESWLSRIATVVGYAHTAGLKVIINIHHDDNRTNGWLDVKAASDDKVALDSITAKFKAVWTQIAQYFKNEGQYLMFEGMNEVQDGNWGNGLADDSNQYNVINQWNQTFVTAVRSAGGENANRFLGIACYSSSPYLASHVVLPTDEIKNHLLLSVHSYDPYNYAGGAEYHEWGHNAKNAGPSGNEASWKSMVSMLYEKFVKKGVPVYFGEYGAVRQDGYETFRLYYMEYVTKIIHDYEMLPVYWDNGGQGSGKENFGLFNRSTYSYCTGGENVVRVMMKASRVTESSSSYSLDQIYNSAPSSSN